MALDDDVRKLAGTRPLDALPREAVQLLAFSCEKRKLASGEALFSEGEPADGAFFVLEGEIVLRRAADERNVGAGVLIGASALLTETVRPSDAVAKRDSVVLRIPRDTFKRVLSEFPESAAKVQKFAQGRARTLISRLEAVRKRGFAPTKDSRS